MFQSHAFHSKGRSEWAPVQNSPWTVNATQQPADAGMSRCYGPGLQDGIEARQPTHFTIEAFDRQGKKLTRVRDVAGLFVVVVVVVVVDIETLT